MEEEVKGARQSALEDMQRKMSLEYLKKEAEERKARSEESRRKREEEVRKEIEEVRQGEDPWILTLQASVIMVVLCYEVRQSQFKHLNIYPYVLVHVCRDADNDNGKQVEYFVLLPEIFVSE